MIYLKCDPPCGPDPCTRRGGKIRCRLDHHLETELLELGWKPEYLLDQHGNIFTRWHPPVGVVRLRPDLGPPMLDV